MSDRQYLIQRHQAWYVKVTIPPSARHLYGGKTHVIRSLKTREISQAKFLRHQVVADIKAEFSAAKGDSIKFAAAKWQGRIANKQFDATEFISEVSEVERKRGLVAAEELSARSFKLHTDLNHLEDKWFAHGALVDRTKTHYRYTRRLLAEHLKREGLPVCIESVTETVAGNFRDHLIALGTHRTTANSILGALRSRFNYWVNVAKSMPPPNPFRGVNIPTPKRGEAKSRRAWKPEELVTLFTGSAEQVLFDIMAMLVCSGMRRGELLDLKGGHPDRLSFPLRH